MMAVGTRETNRLADSAERNSRSPCLLARAPQRYARAMARVDFELRVEINAPMEAVREFLCDLRNYAPLHPLIESIDELPSTEAVPEAPRWRVVDRVPLGPFRLRTVYTATLEPRGPREVHGHADQPLGVRLHTMYVLEPIASGTHLVERVSVEAPSLLRRWVVGKARDSHAKTLSGMKARLEAQTLARGA